MHIFNFPNHKTKWYYSSRSISPTWMCPVVTLSWGLTLSQNSNKILKINFYILNWKVISLPYFFFFLVVWYYLFVTLNKISFFTGLRLRGKSSQRRQSTSLDNLFLAFLFGFIHSLGQKLSIFCSLFLIFLCTQFLQSNTPMFIL